MARIFLDLNLEKRFGKNYEILRDYCVGAGEEFLFVAVLLYPHVRHYEFCTFFLQKYYICMYIIIFYMFTPKILL